MILVDTLPDDVLLAIFDCCVAQREEAWQPLVHVCRRWRSIIFASPRHLKLQLVCTELTPTRDMLDVWPALPLVFQSPVFGGTGRTDNVIAVLERSDRVCQINLDYVSSSDMEIYLAAMQHPFPELTDLSLYSYGTTVPVVPDSFLGGSAPRVRNLTLVHIPFPGLPKLLLSATQLARLSLHQIPHSGYISPEAMVTALSTLTSLEYLTLTFLSPRSCPDQASQRPPPSTRPVIPILKKFQFEGVAEYLEGLAACIDAPRLDELFITFFNDIEFNTPQIMQFISRTLARRSRAFRKGNIILKDCDATLYISNDITLGVKIICRGLEWQVSSLGQVCTSSLPPLSNLEDLYIYDLPHLQPDWKDDIENGLWLQLLRPFTAVKDLYISEQFALLIGPALQELAEGGTTEVLPDLQNIFLERLESSGSVQEGMGKFVAARQVAGRPIAVSSWVNSDWDKRDYYL